MSQVSVVHYNTTSPQKLNILQQNTSTNHSISSERQIIVLRKPPPILPQPKDYSKDDVLITNPGRKGTKKMGGKELKTNPQPIAVARRNARERNRVKQVNNGFANLRQHIPSFIAQAFETNSGRGNKKLSKVETLRMAVEYIRSLEEILALDGDTIPTSYQENAMNISCPSPTSTISQNDSNSKTDLSYSFAMSPSEEEDDISSIATPPPQQYIRINTSTNTYEIIPNNLYENSENLDPMTVDTHILPDPSLIDPSQFSVNNQDLAYLQINSLQTTTGSLSPGMYSEGSLSPNESKYSETPQNCFIPVFASSRLGQNFNVQIKTEVNELPVLSLKSENEVPNSQRDLVDVINWWETQSQPQPTGS